MPDCYFLNSTRPASLSAATSQGYTLVEPAGIWACGQASPDPSREAKDNTSYLPPTHRHFAGVPKRASGASRPPRKCLGLTDAGLFGLQAVVQVANPLSYLIHQLDGPWRSPVRFVGSVIPVHAYSFLRSADSLDARCCFGGGVALGYAVFLRGNVPRHCHCGCSFASCGLLPIGVISIGNE